MSINYQNGMSISRIFVARSAKRVITAEVERIANSCLANCETGGVLVGRRLDETTFLIVAATGPGKNALHHPVEFNPDIDYVNAELSRLCREFPKMDYIGTWHKHPWQYQTFSGGDVNTAHGMFYDPSYNLNEIINPIVWMKDNQFIIRYYYMNRSMAQKREGFIEISDNLIEYIEDDHYIIKNERRKLKKVERPKTILDHRIYLENIILKDSGYLSKLVNDDNTYYFEIASKDRSGKVYISVPENLEETILYFEGDGNDRKFTIHNNMLLANWVNTFRDSYLRDVVDSIIYDNYSDEKRVEYPIYALPVKITTPVESNKRKKMIDLSSYSFILCLCCLLFISGILVGRLTNARTEVVQLVQTPTVGIVESITLVNSETGLDTINSDSDLKLMQTPTGIVGSTEVVTSETDLDTLDSDNDEKIKDELVEE